MEQLEKYFDTAFGAPDGVNTLRRLILSFAFQGKLVPQIKKEKSATTLLNSIAKNVQKQNKKGIEKKSNLNFVDKPSKWIYELPLGWAHSKLNEIGNIFNGNSINTSEKERKYRGVSGLPYIATKDVGYGVQNLDYENGIKIPLSEKNFKIAHAGSVLLCAEGGSAGKKCGLVTMDICFGNKLFALEPYENIPPKFILYYYLSNEFGDIFKQSMSGIIGGVSTAKFNDIVIPLPPLEEQYRIVAKIDELMTHCDDLEKLRAERDQKMLTLHSAAIFKMLDAQDQATFDDAWQFIIRHFGDLYTVRENVAELRKAILQLAVMGKLVPQDRLEGTTLDLLAGIEKQKFKFVSGRISKKAILDVANYMESKVAPIPESWKYVKFGSIVSTRLGKMLDKSKNKGILKPYLRNTNVQWNHFDLGSIKEMKFESDELEEFIIRPGDLLICEGGEPGRCAIWSDKTTEIYFQKALHRARPYMGVNVEYLQICLINDASNGHLSKYITGATIKHLTADKLRQYVIPLPPSNEQKRIAEKVGILLKRCDTLENIFNKAHENQVKIMRTLLSNVM